MVALKKFVAHEVIGSIKLDKLEVKMINQIIEMLDAGELLTIQENGIIFHKHNIKKTIWDLYLIPD